MEFKIKMNTCQPPAEALQPANTRPKLQLAAPQRRDFQDFVPVMNVILSYGWQVPPTSISALRNDLAAAVVASISAGELPTVCSHLLFTVTHLKSTNLQHIPTRCQVTKGSILWLFSIFKLAPKLMLQIEMVGDLQKDFLTWRK